jgi:D-alanine-D-alanine ligase
MNKKIAVLFGGTSSERSVSIKSGNAVRNSLLKSGINAHLIDTRDDFITKLQNYNFNQAYIALHGQGGEDGSIQGVLEYLNIPYTGSGIMASAIAIDKFRSKLIWKACNLPTLPDIFIAKKNNNLFNEYTINRILHLQFPILIKPNNQGSSIGIQLVHSLSELNSAVDIAFNYDNNILIEKFIQGQEYTVSILGKKILPTIHISKKYSLYDYHAKYESSSTKYCCPSGLNNIQEKNLRKIAMKAWNALNCEGHGRIDVILDVKNKFWLLEVNTIPGMTERSLFPMAAKADGISFDELILLILNIKKPLLYNQ